MRWIQTFPKVTATSVWHSKGRWPTQQQAEAPTGPRRTQPPESAFSDHGRARTAQQPAATAAAAQQDAEPRKGTRAARTGQEGAEHPPPSPTIRYTDASTRQGREEIYKFTQAQIAMVVEESWTHHAGPPQVLLWHGVLILLLCVWAACAVVTWWAYLYFWWPGAAANN